MAACLGGLVVAALLSACATESSGSAPIPTATPLPPTLTPTPENGSAIPLERFHYVAALTLRGRNEDGAEEEIRISTEGDYQAPDRHSFTYTIRRGDSRLDQRLVLIGDRAWLKFAGRDWRAVEPEGKEAQQLLSAAFSTAEQDFLAGSEFAAVRDSARLLPGWEQTVNGVATTRYEVGKLGEEYFALFFSGDKLLSKAEDVHWTLWLAQEGGWPVRLRAGGRTTVDLPALQELRLNPPVTWQLQIDISRPDDPELAIRPPVEE